MKKSEAEAHQLLSNTYFKDAFREITCSGLTDPFIKDDSNFEDQHSSGQEKIFDDAQWETLRKEHSCQTQK